mgnify:CR=1 FL=1
MPTFAESTGTISPSKKANSFPNWIPFKNDVNFNLDKNYLIFSGIGNSESFKETLKENKFKVIEELVYPDHYKYKNKDK